MFTINDQVNYWGMRHETLKIQTMGFSAEIFKEENAAMLSEIALTGWHIEFGESVIMPGVKPALKAKLREELAFLRILIVATDNELKNEIKRQDAKTLLMLRRLVEAPPPGKPDFRPHVKQILSAPGMLQFVAKAIAPYPEIIEKFRVLLK